MMLIIPSGKKSSLVAFPIALPKELEIEFVNVIEEYSIPYNQYTYGDIISKCTCDGLSLCNDINLKP